MKSRRTCGWAAIALAVLLTFTGCIGPNHAVGHVAKWNMEFENEWAREGIFLVSLPAYAIFAVGDILIFNSIQWWSGENPISRAGTADDDDRPSF